MVDAVATMALETLRDLLIEEAKFLLRVDGQVAEIGRQLQTMHSFLKDADKRTDRYNSETVRVWVSHLRNLSIEAENALERYVIQVKSKKEGKNLKDKLKRFTCILSECVNKHQIGNEIDDIISRMADLTKQADSLNKGAISSSGPSDDIQLSSRRTLGDEFEQHFVGMEKDIELLQSLLIKSDERSDEVISICGMGGLGKTTLANKLYQMEAVRRCFQARAWICVSQQFQPKHIFQGLLKQLTNEAAEEQSEDELVRKLKKEQREKRCLVVLDDIWQVDDWNSLKRAFPIGEKRCTVLLTSRNKNIASTEYVHELQCLSEEEGWQLLQKIALPINYSSQEPSIIDQLKVLEDIGRQMVRKCGCLPLPISVIGGILRHEKTQSEWEKVYKNIDSYLQRGKGVEENKKVKQVLDLSYDVLPHNLKSCFLYLGCFPEDQKIYTDRLYLIWMGEGMISSEERGRGETLRDVAERYLSELANRCMVQVKKDKDSAYNRFSYCRLHDLTRDLCLSKGKEERFLEVMDADQPRRQDASLVSRLAISSNIKAEDYQLHQYCNLRSLLFLRKGWDTNVVSINFGMFKSLKILILESFDFQNGQLPKGIEKLILLKHFSIEGSYVDELPTSVCKLPCLQSLNLRTDPWKSIRLPNLICKMKRLKYLVLPEEKSVTGGAKLKLDGLNELERVWWFDTSTDDVVDLIKLPKLRDFSGNIYDECSLVMIVDHILNHQDQFRETVFFIQNECNVLNSEIDGGSTLLKKILMCHSLNLLRIYCRLNKLPSYEHQLGRNLLRLFLVNCYILEDPMEMLEKLPMLKELWFWGNSFIGKEIVCRTTGFPQLRELYLDSLPNLVEWRVEEKAMPNLSKLYINNCPKLEMIPEGLKFITTLKELRIISMPEEFTDRVRVVDGQEGEDYHKIKHIPDIFEISKE